MRPQDALGGRLHLDVHVQPVQRVVVGRLAGAVGVAGRGGVGGDPGVPQRGQHGVGQVRGQVDQRGVGVR
ncbi:hypothetical protein [Actinomadura sp. J1-007]|uniref:hypothetical protein n=1 Tax=Actinomadura sp. J1-007 TaxID=2661913 RepID=UPI00137009C5|nr:hypothetical protein [Actinomadura sp. J1-007]